MRRLLSMAAFTLAIAAQVAAQQQTADELARELANPNVSRGLFSFSLDGIRYGGSVQDAEGQSGARLVIQPSLPYPIAPRTNFFLRPLIPVVLSQPVPTQAGFEDHGAALGDISVDAAVGKSWPSGFTGIIGAFASFPTGTDNSISANQTTVGPEALAGLGGSFGFVGLLLTHSWGVSGDPAARANITGGQYFVVVNLGNAWQFNIQPTWAYNWDSPSGDRLTLPVGVGATKTVIAGRTPLKFGLQYWYYVAAPDQFGPKHQLRFTFAPVLPLPW